MTKPALLFAFLISLLSFSCINAQSSAISKGVVLQYVEKAGPIIIDCCSSYPIEIESEYISHRQLNNGRLLINMYVKWTSDTATNCHYRINGELTVDRNGCYPKWLYKDSNKNLGCFIKPGCRWTCTSYFSECL